jgi:hypothetical protein
LDQQLDLQANWSERVVRQSVWLSGLLPSFEKVIEVLSEIGQVSISSSTVWRQVQHWGAGFEAQEAAEREQANLLPLGHSVGAVERKSEPPMGVAMDGTMIPLRHEGWKELKVGCVFNIEPCLKTEAHTGEEIELARAANNSYVTHLGGPACFGQTVWAEARRRGWERAKETEVLGDGAVWIWNLAGEHFYDSYQVVDWYHGTEHLAAAARAIHGEGTPEAVRWYNSHETTLFQGHADRLAAELLVLADKKPREAAEALRREAGYFASNHRRMQYLDMRSEGYVIGSGMVESGGKQFKARFAGPGMRWSREGAEHLLPIRSSIMSGRFDTIWGAVYHSPPN